VINSITGLGYVFTDPSNKNKTLKSLILKLYKFAFRQARIKIIFQNADDQQFFLQHAIIDVRKTMLAPGSGIDMDYYKELPLPENNLTIAYIGRFLWDKGLQEFIHAIRQIKQHHPTIRFLFIGDTDKNPAAIPLDKITAWVDEGLIEWWRWQSDMLKVYSKLHIVCLPSYREGLSRVLLEAAACSRAIITTNVPGCREIIQNGSNGLLIPAHDSQALADALKILIDSEALRSQLGKNARKSIKNKFSVDLINETLLNAYREIMAKN